jgi:formylmethanofuran dehydrogenase subunit B
MAIQNEELEQKSIAGISIDKIEEIADLMINCEFGILFYGLGLTHSIGKERNVEAAISLVRDLNSNTKFSIMPMRGHFNVTGANKVCTWQTGYPFAVDFRFGYPVYVPGDTTVVDVLRRGESDAALVVSSDPVAHFPTYAVKNLCKNPLAVIDPHMSLTAAVSDVVIPSAITGIEVDGTAYRMDGVPLIMKKFMEAPNNILSDIEILRLILREVRSLKRGSNFGASNSKRNHF